MKDDPANAECRTRQLEARVLELEAALASASTQQLSDVAVVAHLRMLQERLRESEERLRLFIEYAPASLAMFDREMCYLSASHRWLSDYGLGTRDLRGLSHYEVFPEIEERWKRIHRRCLAGEVVRCDADRFERADGSVQWLRWEIRPWHDAGGAVAGIVMFTEDITASKRTEETLRESETRLRLAQDAANAGTWEWDLRDDKQFWSDELWRVLGLAPHSFEPTFTTWMQIVHPDDRAAALRVTQEAKQLGTELHGEWRTRHSDGTEHWLMTRGQPVRDADGQTIRYIGIMMDVTERRKAEEALKDADLRKNEFLAVLSHELRNPLGPIRNCVQILERAIPGSVQAERARAVIDRQVRHLVRLIDDLLDVTRISRGKVRLQCERLDITELACRTAEDQRDVLARGGIELTITANAGSLWVYGDPTRLEQVVSNLLQNAAKFTPPNGHTSLTVDRTPDGFAAIRVADTGAGIAPETMAHLFEPFVQADTTLDRSRGGLGLGLALVKGLAALHGGTVRAQSAGLGAGATFTVRLPLVEPTSCQDVAVVSFQANTRAVRRVLVIEDNLDAAMSLKEALEFLGHRVEVALTGPSGLDSARRLHPDVILCDIGLPGMDGYAVCRAVRADPDLAATCLIALSGYASPEDVEKSRLAGFDQHLAKPADLTVLESLLASTLVSTLAPKTNSTSASPPPNVPNS